MLGIHKKIVDTITVFLDGWVLVDCAKYILEVLKFYLFFQFGPSYRLLLLFVDNKLEFFITKKMLFNKNVMHYIFYIAYYIVI